MGTTIRRQPITTAIPASPDYRFLNITNFGGIQKSSNPFVTSSNTASDCLNVYVDEDNALSTRPRLNPKYNFIKLAGITGKCEMLNVFNLHDGYLVYFLIDDVYTLYRFYEDETGACYAKKIGGLSPIGDIKGLFEQNNNIYFFMNNGYYRITDDNLSNESGYIPTLNVGKNKRVVKRNDDGTETIEYDITGTAFESLNVLTPEYKESYFWDGTWNVEKDYDDYEFVENTIISKNFKPGFSTSNGRKNFMKYVSEYYDKENAEQEYVLFKNFEGSSYPEILLGIYDKEKESDGFYRTFSIKTPIEEQHANLPDEITDADITCSEDGKMMLIRYAGSSFPETGKIGGMFLRTSPDSEWIDLNYGENIGWAFTENASGHNPVSMSSDGSVIASLISTSYESNEAVMVYLYDKETDKYIHKRIMIENNLTYNPWIVGVEVSKDGSKIFIKVETDSTWLTYKNDLAEYDTLLCVPTSVLVNDSIVISLKKEQDIKSYKIGEGLNRYYETTISDDGLSVAMTLASDASVCRYFPKIHEDNKEYTDLKIKTGYNLYAPYLIGNKLYICYNDIDSGWFLLDKDYYPFIKSLVKFSQTGDVVGPGRSIPFATNNSYFVANYDKFSNSDHSVTFYKTSWKFDSSEPNIYLYESVYDNEELNEKFQQPHNYIFNADLVQRFDNETWFAGGNSTFHTLYNKPNYIPLSGYNTLGEEHEEITGLSIINDNVLAAYKRNKIYIITPITVGDRLTYSYTETKNVIGNDAKGAPILTILTEMPTIVSYDGIYALNQLENVQSSDRITTLISENINPLWLKEDKSDIDDCITLNRLYWTYYILPHEDKQSAQNNITKVYLLDNRTQQWFYWELPLLCLNAFVKNNKTHLVDYSGKIYTLETSDLINEYNENVTEYYDKINGKKLIIPWHWYSQILSLNTINYAKRLVDTTFILTDTDTQDEYALDYCFKAWRKSVSETNATTINSNIHYVKSTTKRTMIPRFNFIQVKISNTEDDLDNNKLKLVGLGLKYVLLEGLY